MLSEDYLMRWIRITTSALARMLGLRAAGLYEDAIFLIDQTLQQLLGLPGDVVDRLDDASLLAMLGAPDHLDQELTVMLADLTKAKGDVYLDQKMQAESDRCTLRALNLLLAAELARPQDETESLLAKIQPVAEELQEVELPAETEFDLFQVYVINQAWKPALLALDDLLEDTPVPEGLLASAQDFYRQVLGLPDDELESVQIERADVTARLASLGGAV
jgi:hypothetical protein